MKENTFINSSYPKTTPINNINLTSLIDVTLVILIIFMLTAPIIENGIDINLPLATKQTIEKNNSLTVSIGRDNKLYLDNASISILKLEQRLSQIKEADDQTTVILRADKSIPYEKVINVLDIVRKANIHRVSLAIKGN